MNVSKTGLLIALLFIMMVTGLFGTHFGYTVQGQPQGGAAASIPEYESCSGGSGIDLFFCRIGAFFINVGRGLGWFFNSIGFLFRLVTFQVDGMPVFVSSIFVVISVLAVWLIVGVVRGLS